MTSDRSADVAALAASHPEGVHAADVAAALGIGEPVARTYLSRLASAGRIERLGRGVFGPAAGEGDAHDDRPRLSVVPSPAGEAPHNSTSRPSRQT